MNENQDTLYRRSLENIPLGVHSSMRHKDHDRPLYVKKAAGAYLTDYNGRRYLDLNMAYGPNLLGHNHPSVRRGIRRALKKMGPMTGCPSRLGAELAELIRQKFPSIEQMRFSPSGSEAVQAAIRLARAATGRRLIIRFRGHYHGSAESIFCRYHFDAEPAKPQPGSGGMLLPLDVVEIDWNNPAELARILAANSGEVAAVIMEPVPANTGVLLPGQDYLSQVRRLTTEHGALLIFDEVITGCRIAPGGAQEMYGVGADLTILAKAATGGLPLAAVGGRRDIMELISRYEVFHGGVYSGNGLAMAAGVAVQKYYNGRPKLFQELGERTVNSAGRIREILIKNGIPCAVNQIGPMLSVFLLRESMPEATEIQSVSDVTLKTDALKYKELAGRLLKSGIYLHPNSREPLFLSAAHTERPMGRFFKALKEVRL